jgi:hypothetical protein
MKLKEYEVSVQFKVALYDNHDQTLLTIKIQEVMSQAVLNVCKDAYPPMIPTHTYTTVTEKNK